MDYMGMLGKLLSGKDTNQIPGKDKLRTGRNQYSIPAGEYNEFPEGFYNKITGHGTGLGLDNMQVRGGSGAEQIPTGFDNEYVEPTEVDFSKLKFGEDVINTFNPDIPERQPSAIEEPIQPMLMERGEVAPISPVFGKQSLAQMQLEKDEREKMAQVLRGYV